MPDDDDLLDDLDDFTADDAQDRRAIVEALHPLYDARQRRSQAERDEKPLTARVKQWLQLHRQREHEITDDERGLRAYLRPLNRIRWDVRSMPDDLILALGNAGLLTVNTAAFDELHKASPSGTLDAALRWREEIEIGDRLFVEIMGRPKR